MSPDKYSPTEYHWVPGPFDSVEEDFRRISRVHPKPDSSAYPPSHKSSSTDFRAVQSEFERSYRRCSAAFSLASWRRTSIRLLD